MTDASGPTACPHCKAENDPHAEHCFTCGRALHALTKGAVVAERYEIQSVLGKGGMGVVYRARDRLLDEVVALKVLRHDFARTGEAARRFQGEIKLARRVSHRNVCRIHEYGEDGALRYISMEYVDGVNLYDEIRSRGGLPAGEAFDVALQVAKGLQAIHDVGVIHRDLKTGNIMRDSRGVLRLMDFGLAKQHGASGGAITDAGEVVGTPEYMSPEQALGLPVDFRSDVYSLGVVIHEVFTGRLPLQGTTAAETLFKHVHEAPRLDGVPGPLQPPLKKALAKKPEERFATARGLATALRLAREVHDHETGTGGLFARPRPESAEPPATLLLQSDLVPVEESMVGPQIHALQDRDVRVRWRAAVALAEMGAEARDAVPALIEALKDPSPAVSDAASVALARIAGREVLAAAPTPPKVVLPWFAALVRGLDDPDAAARWRAAVAIGAIGPPAREAVAPLTRALDDPDESVRWAAAKALGQIGGPSAPAVPALVAMVSDPEDEVGRGHAAVALGRIGPAAAEAVTALIAAFKDRAAPVREAASEALVGIGSPAVPALVEALRDEEPRIRLNAAQVLTRMSAPPPAGAPGAK